MSTLADIYGGVVRARRRWLSRPGHQRRLSRPVVSIGNLALGGSGKTPLTVAVTELLRELGERPVVLSRGYKRRSRDPLVVVNRGGGPVVDVETSGDEPQLLARALPEVPLVVCADRHRAGRWAEEHLDITVHVLDDGFQHLRLARDVDLVLVASADLTEHVLPAGRLREPLDVASMAHAIVVPGSDDDRTRVAGVLGSSGGVAVPVFRAVSSVGAPRSIHPYGCVADLKGATRALAVAGIARPERFFASAATMGLEVVGTQTFPDHHWYSGSDVSRIERDAQAISASLVVTTEKDAVRLEAALARGQHSVPWVYLPYGVSVAPAAEFRAWFADRLHGAEAARPMDAL